jgi:hypothetical protein
LEQLALEKFKRRENTTFAVVFTFMPGADVVEEKEKGIVKMDRKNGIGKREWKRIGKKDGNRV